MNLSLSPTPREERGRPSKLITGSAVESPSAQLFAVGIRLLKGPLHRKLKDQTERDSEQCEGSVDSKERTSLLRRSLCG